MSKKKRAFNHLEWEISVVKCSIEDTESARVPSYLKIDKWYPLEPMIHEGSNLYVFRGASGQVITSLKDSCHLGGGRFKLRRRKVLHKQVKESHEKK
jgi:hypothetical protein